MMEMDDIVSPKSDLELLRKNKKHLKYEKQKLFRICIYAVITFIICSLIILYFTNKDSLENESKYPKRDDLDLLKDILNKYIKQDNLEDMKIEGDEERDNDFSESNMQKNIIDKDLLVNDLQTFINGDMEVSKERLSEILNKLLENYFNTEHKEKKHILLNDVGNRREGNHSNEEYTSIHNKLSENEKLKNLHNNLKYLSEFHEFMKEHNKKYKDLKEKIEKYENFKTNYIKIEKHNEGNNLYRKKINHFSDYSKKELEDYFKKLVPVPNHLIQKHIEPVSNILKSNIKNNINEETNKDIFKTFPVNLDYRKEGIVHQPKDQALCGSCWAFAGVGSIESIYAKKNKKLLSLSEQEIVDCSKYAYGCDGGHPFYAFLYTLNNKLCLENQYKYTKKDNLFCLTYRCSDKISISSISKVEENKLIQALNYIGPLAVGVAVSDDFIFYHKGIFNGTCAPDMNHAVLLIGYGQVEKKSISNENKNVQKYMENSNDSDDYVYYWILKNSWGELWGEGGFMRIIRNREGDDLFCGIGIDVFYPIL